MTPKEVINSVIPDLIHLVHAFATEYKVPKVEEKLRIVSDCLNHIMYSRYFLELEIESRKNRNQILSNDEEYLIKFAYHHLVSYLKNAKWPLKISEIDINEWAVLYLKWFKNFSIHQISFITELTTDEVRSYFLTAKSKWVKRLPPFEQRGGLWN